MSKFIDAVVRLTALRDRDHLEVSFASAIFDLVSASAVSLWRWTARDDDCRLSEHVSIRSPGVPGPTMLIDVSLETARPDIHACRLRGQSHSIQQRDGGHGCLIPIVDDTATGFALEILRAAPLDEEEERAVMAMVSVYRNLIGSLDTCERDELTTLLNRRTFDRTFGATLLSEPVVAETMILRVDRRRARDDHEQSHLALIDIDFFKRVNDRFGHLYGDEVLVLMARLMARCFRDSDRLFRFGGEEFVVILRGTTRAQARAALERFRETVESFAFPQVGTVTVSIGFTEILAVDTGSHAFGRADEALYVAKRQGRNQVCSREALIADGILAERIEASTGVELF